LCVCGLVGHCSLCLLCRTGSSVSIAQVTLLLIGMVIFTIVLELLLHRTERTLAQHPHYLKMLGKLYQVRLFSARVTVCGPCDLPSMCVLTGADDFGLRQ
jgi:hypothetical protein